MDWNTPVFIPLTTTRTSLSWTPGLVRGLPHGMSRSTQLNFPLVVRLVTFYGWIELRKKKTDSSTFLLLFLMAVTEFLDEWNLDGTTRSRLDTPPRLPKKRTVLDMNEDEQLQAVLAASLEHSTSRGMFFLPCSVSMKERVFSRSAFFFPTAEQLGDRSAPHAGVDRGPDGAVVSAAPAPE